jgi:hypothetical protein
MFPTFSNKLVVSSDLRFVNRPVASDELLKVVNAPTELKDWIRVLDTNDNLVLLHYLTTINSFEDPTVNTNVLQLIGHVRGIIVDTDTMTIVCRSFGYTPEITVSNATSIHDICNSPMVKNMSLATTKFFYACEGTIMRMFFHNNKWYVSTHRKINALNSFWSGPTFGEMLRDVQKFDFEMLNKNYCYVMLLSHPENRIIYKITRGQLLMVTVYNKTTGTFLDDWNDLVPLGVVKPTPVDVESKLKETLTECDTAASFDKAGIIAFTGSSVSPVKFVSDHYEQLKNVRGNDPHMKARYLDLRGTPEGEVLTAWYNEPKYTTMFARIEQELDELARKLHGMYMERYVKKTGFNEIPKEEFVTLRRCHDWFLANKNEGTRKVVTQERVKEFLHTTPTIFLLRMLKRQKQEKRARQLEKSATFPENPTGTQTSR